ncbi:phosphatase PAP2 family protein [Luteitalea sp. TBR-22]|uniref:phosphatase PAP2 family protein n=1 Tax=Luteitalea sp. TBR-22 TaxID=2802971 RepID=UPI001EF5E963|nr:phosphatase PAP2 family protein [Luteitalea sp. TBR-22]
MRMSHLRSAFLLLVLAPAPPCAGQVAQPASPAPVVSVTPEVKSPQSEAEAPQPGAAAPEAATDPRLAGSPGFSGFFKDVGRDYAQWFTLDTAGTLTLGTATALFVRPFDEKITERGFDQIGSSLGAGQEYGNVSFQGPLAVGWWVVGHAVGSKRASAAGRDLVRAQISAASWTYVIKYAVRRTRPNGDARSFPSGHSSATFATATVLQTHYGWKVGLPFYALGVYTAASRIHDRKHWLSDTVMGAAVGVTAGRAVTIRLRQHPVRVVPAITHGGGMVQFVVDP